MSSSGKRFRNFSVVIIIISYTINIGNHLTYVKGIIAKLFLHNIRSSGVAENVQYIKGRSEDVLPTLQNKYYDIIFIDGSHLYEDVSNDIENAKELVAEEGYICGDDLDLLISNVDSEFNDNMLRSKKDYVLEPPMGKYYHPGVTTAVGQPFENVSVFDGFWVVKEEKGLWKGQISIDGCNIEIPQHISEGFDENRNIIKLVLEGDTHNIVTDGGLYIAVAKSIGQLSVLEERIGVREIGDYILIENNLDDLRQRLQDITPFVELVEECETHNIIKAGERYIAIANSLGPMSVLVEKIGEREIGDYILIESDLRELKQRVQNLNSFIGFVEKCKE